VHGKAMELRGAALSCAASAHTMPFDDPQKTKRTAKD
jgi:aminomethyltransferase